MHFQKWYFKKCTIVLVDDVCSSEPSCSQNSKSYDFAIFDKVVGFGDLFNEFILDFLFSAHRAQSQLAKIKKFADLNFQ